MLLSVLKNIKHLGLKKIEQLKNKFIILLRVAYDFRTRTVAITVFRVVQISGYSNSPTSLLGRNFILDVHFLQKKGQINIHLCKFYCKTHISGSDLILPILVHKTTRPVTGTG